LLATKILNLHFNDLADLCPAMQVEIRKGDAVEVEGEEIDGWLQVTRLSDGARGLVPAWAVQLG